MLALPGISQRVTWLSWPIPLRRGLFWWVVVVPALSLVIAFVAASAGKTAWTAAWVSLSIPGILVFALIQGAAADDAPPGVLSRLWLFGAGPLLMAAASLVLGQRYAVLGRYELVNAATAGWLIAWLIGLVGVVATTGPRGRARQISRAENVEVRRAMIERYGLERYLRAADATKLDEVHEPPFVGLLGARLWRVDTARDEPMCVLELVNSTHEPDGSAKSYMLQVPPDVETAHQAVAWTWGMAEHEYHPTVES